MSLIPTVASSSAGGTATRSAAVRPAPFMGRVAPSARAGSSRRRFASGSCASASPGPAAFDSSTAGFGSSNLAAALDAGTFEGTNSTVCDSTSVIVGGNGNTIDSGNGSNGTGAAYTFVGTGEYNLVTGSDDFLGAGYKNEASGADSFAGAGVSNWAEGPASFVGSGDYEYFAEQGPVPPGGNVAAGVDSFVGAGDQNEVIGNESFLGAVRPTRSPPRHHIRRSPRARATKLSPEPPRSLERVNTMRSPASTISSARGIKTKLRVTTRLPAPDSRTRPPPMSRSPARASLRTRRALHRSPAPAATHTTWRMGARRRGQLRQGKRLVRRRRRFEQGIRQRLLHRSRRLHYASVAGGRSNIAGDELSFAAGFHADAVNSGSFVWSDDVAGSSDVKHSAKNQFVVRASGGVTIYSNEGATAGAVLSPGEGTWASLSDRNAKTNIAALDDDSILAKVAALPIDAWSYTSDTSVRHLGPMAQDFYAAFGAGIDDRHVASIDEDGVALAAIKALHRENGRLLRDNRQLHRDNRQMYVEIAQLQSNVAALETKMEMLTTHHTL